MVYLGKDSVFIAGHQSGSATLFPFLEIERGQALYLRNNQAITATDVGREVNSLGAPIACFLGEITVQEPGGIVTGFRVVLELQGSVTVVRDLVLIGIHGGFGVALGRLEASPGFPDFGACEIHDRKIEASECEILAIEAPGGFGQQTLKVVTTPAFQLALGRTLAQREPFASRPVG